MVIRPCLSNRTTSTVTFSFRSILTLSWTFIDWCQFYWKSFFMPMSILCLSDKSWNSTSISSRTWRACLSNIESVQSELDKNWSRESWMSCGFSCSCFREAIISWSTRFCFVVCWLSPPSSWGVGKNSTRFLWFGHFQNCIIVMYVIIVSCV